MAYIYKNAVLTISASCAAHEAEGLFRARHPAGLQSLWLRSFPLDLPARHETSNSRCVIAADPPPRHDTRGMLGHLANRGWAFQEQHFPQRILHFAEEQVHWECRTKQASEIRPDMVELSNFPRPAIGPSTGKENFTPYRFLHGLVDEYSGRQFTYVTDRLPAISGLALATTSIRRSFRLSRHLALEERYLAGLWESTIHADLCWFTAYGPIKQALQPYLAPSWSWASLHGKVAFPRLGGEHGYRPLTEYVDARIKWTTNDPLGAVLDGWMVLRGPLLQVELIDEYVDDSFNMTAPGGASLPFGTTWIDVKLDYRSLSTDVSHTALFCVPVVMDGTGDPGTIKDGGPKVWCLLLVKYGTTERLRSDKCLASPMTEWPVEYERAGVVKLSLRGWDEFAAWMATSAERDIIIR